jgi:hypothetical protein
MSPILTPMKPLRAPISRAQNKAALNKGALISFALIIVALSTGVCNAQSVMFGKRLVSQGDDVTRVREIAGSPDKVDKIPGDANSPPMEIWTYRRKENVIILFVVDAKVVHTQEKPAESQVAGDGATRKDDQIATSR